MFGTVPSSRKEPQTASSLVFKNNRLSDTLRCDHELSQKAMVCTAFACIHFVLVHQGAGKARRAGLCNCHQTACMHACTRHRHVEDMAPLLHSGFLQAAYGTCNLQRTCTLPV